MRKIRFRGQTVDTKELIYGDLIHRPTLNDICIANQNLTRSVSPDTVGQFTGLTDKNGVEIYENDILKSNSGFHCLVKFCEKSAGFIFTPTKSDWCNFSKENIFEVVGNIFDNPELL